MAEAPEIAAPQSHGLRRETISHNTAPIQRTTVEDNGSKATAHVALVIASVCLGILIATIPLGFLAVDASIRAGVATAEQNAKEARTTAKVTEDKVTELRDKLNAKGMNIPPLDGHD